MSRDIAAVIGADRIISYMSLPEMDRVERATVWASTFNWWEDAHKQNTEHHRRFRGYCTVCQQNKTSK